MTQDTNTTSGAADLPEALRLAGMQALLQCAASDLENLSPMLFETYSDDVQRVFAAITAQAINPGDTEAGPEGEWYCETHPDQLMGHDGCGGAGIPACARIGMLMNQLRLTRQEVREANRMRDEMASSARRASAISAEPAGAGYAELPKPHCYEFREPKERYIADQLLDFADRTHALRVASHGQAPAGAALASSDPEGHRQAIADHEAEQVPAGATVRHLEAVIKGAADKLDAAVRCHPNAVDTLIHAALEILDGDREPYCTPTPQAADTGAAQKGPGFPGSTDALTAACFQVSTTNSLLYRTVDAIGKIVTTCTAIPREIEPYSSVASTKESMEELRRFYEGLPVQVEANEALLGKLRTLIDTGAATGDDVAVDMLSGRMKGKLAKQRAKGYGGWDSTECTQQHLSNLLRAHVDKGDPVDVANFCAFLSARGEGIAPPVQGAAGAPDCGRCKGSGEDPEGFFDQSRGPDGDTHEGPCRSCGGSGAAQGAGITAGGGAPSDPMDWPLPCDVKVGHGTMCKGVPLRTLVSRMKVLYEMATGNNADVVANRTPEENTALSVAFRAQVTAITAPPVEQADETMFNFWRAANMPEATESEARAEWSMASKAAIEAAAPQPAPPADSQKAPAPSDEAILAAARNWGEVKQYHRTDGKGTEHRIVFNVHQRAAHFARELFAARAQADSVLEDAARYQWLRNFHADEIHDDLPYIAAGESYVGAWALHGVDADKAIDAARKQGGSHD